MQPETSFGCWQLVLLPPKMADPQQREFGVSLSAEQMTYTNGSVNSLWSDYGFHCGFPHYASTQTYTEWLPV